MASDRENDEERKVRVDMMIGQFREAQKRRLMQRGIVLWKRAEAAERAMVYGPPVPPAKIH